MDAELPDEVAESIADMKAAIAQIEAHLMPLLQLQPATATALSNPLAKAAAPQIAGASANGTLKDLVEELSPLESSKLYAGLAYSLQTLYFMYLRTQGTAPESTGVKKELDRVKSYIKKVTDASNVKLPAQGGPNLKVDRAAAARFIASALTQTGEVTIGRSGTDKPTGSYDDAGAAANAAHAAAAAAASSSSSAAAGAAAGAGARVSAGQSVQQQQVQQLLATAKAEQTKQNAANAEKEKRKSAAAAAAGTDVSSAGSTPAAAAAPSAKKKSKSKKK